jgi:hypothetical protein
VAVAEGQQISESVAMEPGVEAEVTVLFRNEARIPVLALIRPDGWSELEGVPAHVLDTCAVFRVSLPLDTLGLEAYVRGRKGSVAVLPGQLATGQPLPSFWIELGSEETYELGERRRQAAGSEVGDRPRRAPKGKKK